MSNNAIKILNFNFIFIFTHLKNFQVINVKYLYEILDTHGENLNENWFGQLMTYPQTLAYLIQINMWLEEYNLEIAID